MDSAAAAIADPVRRAILDLLAVQPQTAGDIADHFPISRPAVSRHLRVLRESGLVHDELVGRHRRYRLDPEPLAELTAWLTSLVAPGQPSWSQRLDALDTEVHRTRRDRTAARPTISQEDTA